MRQTMDKPEFGTQFPSVVSGEKPSVDQKSIKREQLVSFGSINKQATIEHPESTLEPVGSE